MKTEDVKALRANCRKRETWERDKWQKIPWQVGEYVIATDAHALLAILGKWTEKTGRKRPLTQLAVASEWLKSKRPATFKTTVDLLRLWCDVEIPKLNDEDEILGDNEKRAFACGRLRKTLFDRRLIDRVLLGRDGAEVVSVHVDGDTAKWVTIRGNVWVGLVMPMWEVGDGRKPVEVSRFPDEMKP
jgi:hypothetical protein